MAKITVTTDQGVLVEQFTEADIGDLDKPLAAADFLEDLKRAVETARREESL